MEISRRNFIKTTALAGVSFFAGIPEGFCSTFFRQSPEEISRKRILLNQGEEEISRGEWQERNDREDKESQKFLDAVTPYICKLESEADIVLREKGKKTGFVAGYGVMIDGYYITLAHIHNYNINPDVLEVSNERYKIGGTPLERKVFNVDTDIAIFEPPKKSGLKNYPYGINTKPPQKGDAIYLIGDPGVKNHFRVSEGKVVGLEDFGDVSSNCFSTDISIFPGDSACPIVDKNYRLLGLAQFYVPRAFVSYAKKINSFTSEITKLKRYAN